MGEEAGRAGETRLLRTSHGSAGNVLSCLLSLTLSPEPSCGIQGVGLGFSSCTFLLRAAKPLISLCLPPPQQTLLNSTPWKWYLFPSPSQLSLVDGTLLPLHIAPASSHSVLSP